MQSQDSWFDLKEQIFGARAAKPVLVVLAVIVIMVAGFAGKQLFDPATAKTYTVETSQARSDAGDSGLQTADASAGDEPVRLVYVDVEGAVERPGVVALAEKSRVCDAVEAAGGLTEDAAAGYLNLARLVSDGEQISVPTPAEIESQMQEGDAGQAAQTASPAGGTAAGATAKVNINTADETTLQTVVGIGPSTARKIVGEREKNGPFASVDDLKRVSGIGDKKLDSFRDQLCV